MQYQRDCPHHVSNEVHLLSIFLIGIVLVYHKALYTASEGHFNTRLIEILTSSNSTKNTNFERNKSAANLGKEQMDGVKENLDNVHKLFKKQVSFAKDVEAVDVDSDKGGEEDVNYISGTDFQSQRFENQNGNMNFGCAGQRSNFSINQGSQNQKPFNNSNNMNYGTSFTRILHQLKKATFKE